MGAALAVVDVVGVAEHLLAEPAVVFERDLDADLFAPALEVHRLRMDRLLVAVQILDELLDAAGKLEHVLARLLLPPVTQRDANPLVEKRQLAQPRGQHLERVIDRFEDAAIGQERGHRAAAVGDPGNDDRSVRLPAAVGLAIDPALLVHLYRAPLGERVDHRNADAVQAGRHRVVAVVELAAGVQRGHYHLQRAHLLLGVLVDRNTAPVVAYRHHVPGLDGYLDGAGKAGHRLVDAVVDHLIHQLMQAVEAGRPNVHSGPLAYRLQTLQHLNVNSRVLAHTLPGFLLLQYRHKRYNGPAAAALLNRWRPVSRRLRRKADTAPPERQRSSRQETRICL